MFSPAGIAVIGARDREESIARASIETLSTFDCDVVPINPNRETGSGTAWDAEIGDGPAAASFDLAIIVVSPDVLGDVVRQAAAVGVQNVVVITAGFGERRPEGEHREREAFSAGQ